MSADAAAFLCVASPSLALLKYWGKQDSRRNLPATPSLALTLAALRTRTRVEADRSGSDEVQVDGTPRPPARYAAFFDDMRRALRADIRFKVDSWNDFPSSAGLASSSSGLAALALAGVRAGEELLRRERPSRRLGPKPRAPMTDREISALARLGSASAARAVFGGFSLLPAGGRAAELLFGPEHWPELRILVALVSQDSKPISSREAMERSRLSSPYYRAWVRDAALELEGALSALERRDLEALGSCARRSYLRMFGTMLSADPPVLYWLPESLAILLECEAMRAQGLGVWETMDAGPQVKMLCLAKDLPLIAERIKATGAAQRLIESGVGGAPRVDAAPEVDATPAFAAAPSGRPKGAGRPEGAGRPDGAAGPA